MKKFLLITSLVLGISAGQAFAQNFFDEDFFYENDNILNVAELTASEMVAAQEEQPVPREPKVDVRAVKAVETEEKENESPVDVALADETVEVEATLSDTTHPLLKLTPDKSEMIRLEAEAASVIVGNPNHISVLLDTPNTIIVVPRAPGASHFTVIGEEGNVLMQRHVVVAAPQDKYVRIRRSCNANSRDCQQTSVYYCPNMCHEVSENTQRQR